MRKTIGLLLLLAGLWPSVWAQSGKAYQKDFYDGNFYLLYGNYEEALPYFSKLVEEYPGNANLNYKTGLCLLHIPGSEGLAIDYLEKAVLHITRKYRQESHRETKAPPEAILKLGIAYRMHGELEKAKKQFQEYRQGMNSGDPAYEESLRQEQMCTMAESQMDGPDEPPPVSIPDINEGDFNYNPSLSGNGQWLAFMNKRRFYKAVMISENKNGSWSEPKNITAQIESDGDYECVSLSSDGQRLLLTRKNNDQNDLYLSRKKEGLWSKAIPLPEEVNSIWNEPWACFSPDGKMLYFASDRPGGYGDMDLYSAEMDEDGNLGEVRNLGNTINTRFTETAPFMTDDHVLYFSSDGHPSMGGLDMFVSREIPAGWSEPENLGFPVNSTRDDTRFLPTDPISIGILARAEAPGISQLMWFMPEKAPSPVPVPVTGLVSVRGGPTAGSLEELWIQIRNNDTGEVLRIHPDSLGTFQARLLPGTYELMLSGEGIRNKQLSLQVQEGISPAPIEMSAEASPVEPVFLPAIHFGFDRVIPDPDSEEALQLLLKILRQYPALRIRLRGHTDAVGTQSYNMSLSLRRAEAVRQYLAEQGISADRLEVKGFGEDEPLVPNQRKDGTDFPEGRRLNRRVDFAILNREYSFIQNEKDHLPNY